MKTAIVNIGVIVSGDLKDPFPKGNTIIMQNGIITYVGDKKDADLHGCTIVLDADGSTVIPGLIDSHLHNTFGDYTPRQKTVDFLESYVHGGITTGITASEVHTPGRPSDREGVKALAIAAQRCFEHLRPGGMKVYAGSVIIEPGLTEGDFKDLREQGVWLAKAGFGNFDKPKDATAIVRAAQRQQFKVMCHTGGASIPGSSPVTADDLLEMLPDVSGHVNGGPTAMTDDDLEKVIRETSMALQIVQAGNIRTAIKTVEMAKEMGQLYRLLIASDTPTGTGMMPLSVMKSVVEMSCLTAGVSPEEMIAAATGNVAEVYGIDAGFVRQGRAADILVIDAPLGGSRKDALSAIRNGDIPAISGCFTAGVLRYVKSRNTPPPIRNIRVTEERLNVWMS